MSSFKYIGDYSNYYNYLGARRCCDGIRGCKGPQGADGPQGSRGSAGYTGATGSIGAQGNTGYGCRGPTGAPGTAGVTGSQGATGSSGINSGIIYYLTTPVSTSLASGVLQRYQSPPGFYGSYDISGTAPDDILEYGSSDLVYFFGSYPFTIPESLFTVYLYGYPDAGENFKATLKVYATDPSPGGGDILIATSAAVPIPSITATPPASPTPTILSAFTTSPFLFDYGGYEQIKINIEITNDVGTLYVNYMYQSVFGTSFLQITEMPKGATGATGAQGATGPSFWGLDGLGVLSYTGDVKIDGKLDVRDGIDPTYIGFTKQSTYLGLAPNTIPGIWMDRNISSNLRVSTNKLLLSNTTNTSTIGSTGTQVDETGIAISSLGATGTYNRSSLLLDKSTEGKTELTTTSLSISNFAGYTYNIDVNKIALPEAVDVASGTITLNARNSSILTWTSSTNVDLSSSNLSLTVTFSNFVINGTYTIFIPLSPSSSGTNYLRIIPSGSTISTTWNNNVGHGITPVVNATAIIINIYYDGVNYWLSSAF